MNLIKIINNNKLIVNRLMNIIIKFNMIINLKLMIMLEN